MIFVGSVQEGGGTPGCRIPTARAGGVTQSVTGGGYNKGTRHRAYLVRPRLDVSSPPVEEYPQGEVVLVPLWQEGCPQRAGVVFL